MRDTTAQFFAGLDRIEVTDPALTRVVADKSSSYRTAKLWLEATLRKTPLPVDDATLSRTPRRTRRRPGPRVNC
ncbi:hypothetical protein [Serinicoccus marinus]|uniref:hypothetical protein n=1 Tax=Serinicoccus marinus TaxID=247333 RepID=UPI002491A310|nr:hypothetical protein [Serinicoccus marinus]